MTMVRLPPRRNEEHMHDESQRLKVQLLTTTRRLTAPQHVHRPGGKRRRGSEPAACHFPSLSLKRRGNDERWTVAHNVSGGY